MSEERLHAGSVQILEGGKIFQFYNIKINTLSKNKNEKLSQALG